MSLANMTGPPCSIPDGNTIIAEVDTINAAEAAEWQKKISIYVSGITTHGLLNTIAGLVLEWALSPD